MDIYKVRDLINSASSKETIDQLDRDAMVIGQLKDSIEFLNKIAAEQKDYDKKAGILKEITAAEREISILEKKILKLETKNE